MYVYIYIHGCFPCWCRRLPCPEGDQPFHTPDNLEELVHSVTSGLQPHCSFTPGNSTEKYRAVFMGNWMPRFLCLCAFIILCRRLANPSVSPCLVGSCWCSQHFTIMWLCTCPVHLQILPSTGTGCLWIIWLFCIFTNVHKFPTSHRVRMPLVWDLATGRRCHRQTAVFGHFKIS